MAEQALTNGADKADDLAPPVINDDSIETDRDVSKASEVDEASEKEATDTGWVPEDKWKGPKERWVPAAEWNDRRQRVMPFVQKENFKLQQEIKKERADKQLLADRIEAMEKREQERQTSRTQIEESSLKTDYAQALANQDFALAAEINDKMLELKVAKSVPRETPSTRINADAEETKAVMGEFFSANPLFNDSRMQELLAREVQLVRGVNPTMAKQDVLDEAKDRVQRMYPERFERKRAPAMAETGGRPSRSVNGERQWNDLKKENRQVLDDFIKGEPAYQKMGVEAARKRLLAQCRETDFVSR